MFTRLSFLVVAGLLSTAAAAGAQTNTGQIAGIVRDAQGGALPGATVIAEHLESGTRVTTLADEAGRYLLPSLRVGGYTITAELAGFRRLVRSGVIVQLGQVITLDLELDVGGPTESVIVSADVPLLQRANAEVSDVIENREVVQFPLNGRNFLALAQLSDAVVIPPGGTRGEALQQAGPLPNVGGQRSGHNIYLLDGVKVTDELFNNLVINPSVDSIQEFKIQKSQYPAEFGGKASALINVATRAGANRWHGSLFEFFRNDALDAHNYFDRRDQPVPPLRQKQFGGTLGGPVVRATEFFFASVEGPADAPIADPDILGPYGAVRSGDFSGMAAICDPVTITRPPGRARHSPAIGSQRTGSIRWRWRSSRRCRCRRPRPQSQNLTSVGELVKDVEQISVRLDHRLFGDDRISPGSARSTPMKINRSAPAACRRRWSPASADRRHAIAERGGQLQQRARHIVFHEFRAGWLDVSGGQVYVNRGDDFAARVGLLGVARPGRQRLSADVDARGLQYLRRSDLVRVAPQPALRALLEPADRSRCAPAEVRRISLPPAVQARATRQRSRDLYLHRPVHGQPVGRFPARLSHVGVGRDRTRRSGCAHDLVPRLRAGRLAHRAPT